MFQSEMITYKLRAASCDLWVDILRKFTRSELLTRSCSCELWVDILRNKFKSCIVALRIEIKNLQP